MPPHPDDPAAPARPFLPPAAIWAFGFVAVSTLAFWIAAELGGTAAERAERDGGTDAVESAAGAAAAPAEAPSPFADLPTEEPDEPFRRKRRELEVPRRVEIPPLLAEHPDWERAQALAAEASELALAAQAAREAGDTATFREQGAEAQTRYEQALELTASWVERFTAALGEDHPQLQALEEIRAGWRRQTIYLHKLVGGSRSE